MTRASDRLPGETAVDAVLRAAGLRDFLSIRYGTELWDRIQTARETDLNEEEARRQARRRADDFDNGLCPALYRDTDPGRLPEAAARVLGHAYGPKGLLAHGPTGRGKTRAMWLLLRRLHVVEGKSLAYRDALEFAEEAVASYRGNVARAWVDRLVGVGVFFLDDLGKARITQRVGEALFAVIDRRALRGRPTYLTTNFVGETLKLRLDDQETADPLVRRLKEFFTPISF